MGMLLPVRDALDFLSGKWKLPIIISLSFGNKRFKELATDVQGITDKMLSKELRDLEHQLQTLTLFNALDPAWLDVVMPLKIVSPMVGKCHLAPTPDSPPYVKKGDFFTPSTIVATIEAMLVFNEIEAGLSGAISGVLVSNGETVDYGQPMFLVARPSRLLAGG